MGTEFRVYGPPGTGKTTYLSGQIANAAERYGSDGVVVASFTKAAARELVNRNLPVDRENVGTLHALCFRLLGRPVIAESRIKEWNTEKEQYALTVEAVDVDDPALERQRKTRTDEYFVTYQLLRAWMRPRDQWPIYVQAFAKVWELWKREHGYLDFTDLIEQAYLRGLGPPPGVIVGFFDEAQDFTRLEMALVRQWAEHLRLVVLCGDDDQLIYRFKGATPDAFIGTPIPPENVRVLSQSYRVPASVHARSQLWVSLLREREPKEYRPRATAGSVTRVSATYAYPDALITLAQQATRANRRTMLLATCGYMLDPLIRNLRASGIPFHNPYRRTNGAWNPLHPGSGVSTGEKILAFLRPDRQVWGEEARIWTGDDLKQWTSLIRAEGVLRRGAKQAIGSLVGTTPLDPGLIRGWFEDGVIEAIRDGGTAWLRANVLPSQATALDFPLLVAERHGTQALFTSPSVIVGTIHSVKGGEADTVTLFPDLSMAAADEWHSSSDGRDAIRRTFYVGMTRTRDELILCDPATRRAVDL